MQKIKPERDPLLDLPLTIVPPSPPMRANQSPQQTPRPVDNTATASQTPVGSAAPKNQDATSSQPKQKDGKGMNVLDHVIYALKGNPTRELTPEDKVKREKRQKEAGKASAAFANDPEAAAESYMGAPGTGGGGLNLSKIIKFLGGSF